MAIKSFANKFNKSTFGINTEGFKYCKLGDIYTSGTEGGKDVVHPINGIYVHRSPLGDSPVIIDEKAGLLVNCPSHMGETFREILADSEAVDAIKEGKVGYTIYDYESHGKTCYAISFVDIQ